MDINFLFFDNFETLDIFGPIEILSRMDNVVLHYVSLQGETVRSRQGYLVQTVPVSAIDPYAVLVVPGGQGTRTLVNDEIFLAELKSLSEKAKFVLTICTGSALLAKTGLLDGKNATSNKRAFDWVKSVSRAVNWIRPARWVVDGKFYTSSGVSAGMDMALGFVEDRAGREKAEQIAKDIEYVWNRENF